MKCHSVKLHIRNGKKALPTMPGSNESSIISCRMFCLSVDSEMDKWPERYFSITFNPTLRPAIHFDVCLFEVRRGRVCVGMNAETVMLVHSNNKQASRMRTGVGNFQNPHLPNRIQRSESAQRPGVTVGRMKQRPNFWFMLTVNSPARLAEIMRSRSYFLYQIVKHYQNIQGPVANRTLPAAAPL